MARFGMKAGVLLGVVIGLSLAAVTMFAGAAQPGSAKPTSATDVVTSPTLDRIKSSGKLRACVDPEFPPEVYTKGGQIAGFDPALTKELAAGLGVDVVWVQTNFDGLIAGLQAGKCDISLSGVTPRGKRALAVSFAKPTLAGAEGVIVQKSSTKTTFASLNNSSVQFCAQTGTGSDFDQKKYFPKAKVTKVPSADTCLLQLLAKKADATITDTITGNGWVKAHPKEIKLVLTGAGLPAAPVGAAVVLGDFGFVAYINVFFGEWINNGNYEPTFKREMGYAPDMQELFRQRANF
jgi:polar amino acid transport system substrate-binding protein